MDDGPSSSNSKSKEDNKSTAGGMTEEKGKSFTEIALGNYLILKNIIQHLENNDVGSCCRVNEFWRYTARPLYVTHYQVKLEYDDDFEDSRSSHGDAEDSSMSLRRCRFQITAHATDDRNKGILSTYPSRLRTSCCTVYPEDPLEEASKFLLEAAKASKIAISFRSTWKWEEDLQEGIGSLLAEIGDYVTRFPMGRGEMSLSATCKWLRLMPNLIHLDWDVSRLLDEYPMPDPNDESIPLRSLRIIHLRNFRIERYPSVVFILKILKMAPNLEEFWSCPVILVEDLVETGKAFAIKSISPVNTEDDYVKAAFQTLSHMGLKLKEFPLINNQLCDPDYQRYARRILKSSRDSLEILSVSQNESFDFQRLPPITSLKEIELQISSEFGNENGGMKFFAPNTELRRIFPNVSALKFRYLRTFPHPPPFVYVNEEQFASWGPQIKHLKLVDFYGTMLRQMSLLFPSFQHLEFGVSCCDELGDKLREIGEHWPDVESLTFKIDTCYTTRTLDSAFTGIPEIAVAYLRDPERRKSHFSSEQIENLKEGSVLRRLSKLKILKFALEGYYTFREPRYLVELLCDITAVSKEFGFQFLPDFKIVLRASDWQFQEVSDVLRASRLGTLVSYEVEYAESPRWCWGFPWLCSARLL